MKSFGEQLSEARKAKHVTQEQLAEMLGITRQGISHWERGRSLPDIEVITRISKILEYEFVISEEAAEEPEDDGASCIEEQAPVVRRKPFRRFRRAGFTAIGFLAGALVMLLILEVLPAMLRKAPQPETGYSRPATGGSGEVVETVSSFREKSAPEPGASYVVISFSDDPCYVEKDPFFTNGYGWNYTVYLTEYNDIAFYPETFTQYFFVDESHSLTSVIGSEEMEEWWGECRIPERGQRCVVAGNPLQNIIGVGIKLAGHDENGKELAFYGYMEFVQHSREAAGAS